jgi:hypothetical protein
METDELFLAGNNLNEKVDFAGAFSALMQAAQKGRY